MRSSHPALLPPYRPPPAAPPTKLNNLKENTMIDTLLQKYDSLQRKSESLGLSCSEDSFCRHLGEEQVEWETGNERRIVKVVADGSEYGGKLEHLAGFSEVGYEVTAFDEVHLKKTEGFSHVYLNRREQYSDDLYRFVTEDIDLINTFDNVSRENNIDLENEEIVKQTSRFFGLNLVRLLNILLNCCKFDLQPLI